MYIQYWHMTGTADKAESHSDAFGGYRNVQGHVFMVSSELLLVCCGSFCLSVCQTEKCHFSSQTSF